MTDSIWKTYNEKWIASLETEKRCRNCMSDAPHVYCCKHSCGDYTDCDKCTATCRTTKRLCEK